MRITHKYFVSDLVSQFGSSLSFIALNWYVLQKGEGAESVGWMIIFDVLGRFVATFFAGRLTDSYNRKYVLIVSNLLRALFIALILLCGQELSVVSAYLLAFVGGMGLTITMTASRAFMQEIVPENEIVAGHSYLERGVQLGMLISGALTGFLYKAFSIQLILGIEIGTFLMGVVLLFSLPASIIKRGNTIKDTSYFKTNPAVLIFACMMMIPYAATVASNTVMPSYVLKDLQSDVGVYGILCASYCMGGVIASFFVKRLTAHGFLLISLIAVIWLTFNHNIFMAYALIFAFGLANSSIKIITQSVLMKNIAHEYMGRALAKINLISTLLQVLATYLGALIIDKFSFLPSCLILVFIMMIAYGLFIQLSSRLKVLKGV